MTGNTQKTAVGGTAGEPWHHGLRPWPNSTGRGLPNFYYQWASHGSCAAYATYGCWKIEIVTRHVCPHGVMVVAEQTRAGADLGAVWGFGRRLAARTRAVVELDAGESGVSARLNSMTCNPVAS